MQSRERERDRESGSGSRGVHPTLLCCTSTVKTHIHMHAYVLINRLTCVSVHTYTHASPHPSFSELSVPLTKTNALSIPLTSRRHSRNTAQGLKYLDPTGEKALRTHSPKNREHISLTSKVRSPSEENNVTKSQPIGLTFPTYSPPPTSLLHMVTSTRAASWHSLHIVFFFL